MTTIALVLAALVVLLTLKSGGQRERDVIVIQQAERTEGERK